MRMEIVDYHKNFCEKVCVYHDSRFQINVDRVNHTFLLWNQ